MSNSQQVVRQLIIDRDQAKANQEGWKDQFDKITDQLAEVVKPEGHLKAAGKLETGGSTTVEDSGGKFTFEAAKSVKWDSDKLQNIAAGLKWNMVISLFKIKFEMTETQYKNLVSNVQAGVIDQSILDAVNDARTVNIGEAKIKSAELIQPKS